MADGPRSRGLPVYAPAVERHASRESLRRSMEALLRLSSSRRGFAQRMATVGVALTQPAVATLAHVCEHGPLPMGELARATRNDQGATARQVAALEADGLLVRERSNDDGRVILVRATDTGRETAARVARVQTHHLDTALQDLSDDQLAECAEHLARLVRLLRDTEVPPLPDRG
jgi:DNA-binding MarR family transcriptional regulator